MLKSIYDAIWNFMYRMASPRHFYTLSSRLIPWLGAACALSMAYSLYMGLWVAPPDYQQGESYRIIFVHVPSAWMSLFSYVFMATCAGIHLIWRMKLADVMAMQAAPLGAWFTFLALATGS
ncbi:MAG: cytochrome c biogenesis protein CcsA, partial [Chromatiales bacterium]|nr:cytochrome c biogenesis protein CcsA [Chromatiales bacterium]